MENNKSRKNINTPENTPFTTPETTSIETSVIPPLMTIYDERGECHNIIEREREIENEPLLDTLILNLKIISKIKPGHKLSIKENENNELNDVYIDNSYLQYINRLFSDNSRELTILFLEKLDLNISTKIQKLIITENKVIFLNSNENILLNLSRNLNLSLVGLNNLINTYNGDEYTISKIEMIIQNFELKILKITNYLNVN